MRHEVNEVKYERGMERYVFRFDGRPDSLLAAYQAIGDTARDPDLEFNWQDAALVERMVRELVTHKREGGG